MTLITTQNNFKTISKADPKEVAYSGNLFRCRLIQKNFRKAQNLAQEKFRHISKISSSNLNRFKDTFKRIFSKDSSRENQERLRACGRYLIERGLRKR